MLSNLTIFLIMTKLIITDLKDYYFVTFLEKSSPKDIPKENNHSDINLNHSEPVQITTKEIRFETPQHKVSIVKSQH